MADGLTMISIADLMGTTSRTRAEAVANAAFVSAYLQRPVWVWQDGRGFHLASRDLPGVETQRVDGPGAVEPLHEGGGRDPHWTGD